MKTTRTKRNNDDNDDDDDDDDVVVVVETKGTGDGICHVTIYPTSTPGRITRKQLAVGVRQDQCLIAGRTFRRVTQTLITRT
ncbi:hypothetical protein M0802_003836 [Mischocyttarus mexicanus]|nr:hypothetical protein M0802_003836 [Mischocyttarus mexicanus]